MAIWRSVKAMGGTTLETATAWTFW